MAQQIYKILPIGEAAAIPGWQLCEELNISQRELSRQITKERREGKPICANSLKRPGYYLAANQQEMDEYCERLKHRAKEIFITRQACMKARASLPPVTTE